MDAAFFPSYRKTLLSPEEVLLSIEIPYSREVSVSPHAPTLPRVRTWVSLPPPALC